MTDDPWQPIETVPEFEPVLVFCPGINRGHDSAEVVIVIKAEDEVGGLSFWSNGGPNGGIDIDFEPDSYPTHWRPLLPLLPKAKPAPRTRGRLIREARITREQVKANPETLFCFGDNMEQRGFGGQAAAMRGEPNAVGIPTKWRPTREASAYFSDRDMLDERVREAMNTAFDRIEAALANGQDVVVPQNGIGTGLAELPARAPSFARYLATRFLVLERKA